MCIGIIRNNALVGERARAKAQTPATERVTLYCTWRPSALTTRPHGQVQIVSYRKGISYRQNTPASSGTKSNSNIRIRSQVVGLV